MSLTNDQISAKNFKKFLAAILPYIGGGGGHTIKDSDDTEMTKRAGLKFGGDLEVSDDSEDDVTKVAPHRLTSEDMAEIMSTLPTPVNDRLPVLFDEQGTERVVGWYVNSNGLRKPVYEKDFHILSADASNTPIEHNIQNIEFRRISDLTVVTAGNGKYFYMMDQIADGVWDISDTYIHKDYKSAAWGGGTEIFITIQYTKTTDAYQ